MRRRLYLATALAAGLLACAQPAWELGGLRCDQQGRCLEGYQCLAGRCVQRGADAGPAECSLSGSPVLDLDFASGGEFDPRIVFSRSSVATYVDSSGLIRTAAADEPRFDHDPLSGALLGLLVEESRTNLVTEDGGSESLGGDDGATAEIDAAIAPDGTMTADKLVESPAAMGVKNHYDAIRASANTDGRTYTWSVFAKAAERNEIFLVGGAEDAGAFFDLTAGTVTIAPGSPADTRASIQPFANGWHRCVLTYVRTSGQTNGFQFLMLAQDGTADYTGQGTAGAYFWGTQAEEGANATSYIKTSGSEVTRAADRLVVDNAGLFGSRQGTVSSSILLRDFTLADQTHYELSDGVNPSSRLGAITAAGRTDTNYVGETAILSTATSSAPLAGQTQRNAFAFAGLDFAASVNGAPAVALSDAAPSPAPSQLTLGHSFDQGAYLDGILIRVRYFATRLPDAELPCLTRW